MEAVNKNDDAMTLSDNSELEATMGEEALVNVEEEIKERESGQDVERSTNSVSDEEYNELCDAVLQRSKRKLADGAGRGPDEDLGNPQSEDDELQDIEQQQHHTDNIHSDLVTPELSAEEKESVPKPPKLCHKKSHKKKTPQADRRRRSGKKLEYESTAQPVSLKRKLLPKSDPKRDNKRKRRSKKRKLQERMVHEDGTWVQCVRSECLKWRYLSDVTDPARIPEYWVCKMNTDSSRNSCECPEEDYHALEFVFTKFTEGSIVWAKMQGFPWWPAMVEEDPDTGTYLEQEDTDTYPTHYHVVFLDQSVSRTWLKSSFIRKYDPDKEEQTYAKGRDYKQQVSQAITRANQALSMNVQERIKTFGFSHTFKGKIVDDDSQGSTTGEAVSIDADSDDESEDLEIDLDLEILGLDVDEILEEAEVLLCEAGETMQSLQDTPLAEVAPKKTKRSRKSKKIMDGEACEGNIDEEGKIKRQYKKRSLKDDSGEIGDNKKKKRKLHRCDSKKTKDKGTKATKDDTAKHLDEGIGSGIGDILGSELKEMMPQSKLKDDDVKEDGLTKKAKKQRIKKSCNSTSEEATGKTGGDDARNQCEKPPSDASPTDKKTRKPRAKKSDIEVDPRVNIVPSERSTKTGIPLVESDKQESTKLDGDIKLKEKKSSKPTVKKPNNNLTPKENSEKEPSVMPKAQYVTERVLVKESENQQQLTRNNKAAVPKERKARKPRVKKSDGEDAPKVKKPRVRKFAAKTNAKQLNEMDTLKAESKKIKDVRGDTDSMPRVKKPKAIKASTGKPSADLSKTSTAKDVSTKLTVRAQGSPNNQDDDSKVKSKKKIKTDEAGPKSKPAFKPPSKKYLDVGKKPKKSSFAVPMVNKDEQSSRKVLLKETSKDGLSSDFGNETSDALMPVEGRTEIENKDPPESDSTSATTGPGDAAGVIKHKAKKFSIKKKAEKISMADASSCINQNRSPPLQPAGDAYCTDNKQPQMVKKNPQEKGPAKKFSIKRKTPVSDDSSVALLQPATSHQMLNKTSPDTGRNDNRASEMKTAGVNKPTGETGKPASKKSSTKREASSVLTETNNIKPGVDASETMSLSAKKQRAEQQQQPYVDDDEFLDLDEDFLDEDTVLVVEDLQEDGGDAGQDSDDFSMEDLEDWLKDPGAADEPPRSDPSKLRNLTGEPDDNPQSFEIVEE